MVYKQYGVMVNYQGDPNHSFVIGFIDTHGLTTDEIKKQIMDKVEIDVRPVPEADSINFKEKGKENEQRKPTTTNS